MLGDHLFDTAPRALGANTSPHSPRRRASLVRSVPMVLSGWGVFVFIFFSLFVLFLFLLEPLSFSMWSFYSLFLGAVHLVVISFSEGLNSHIALNSVCPWRALSLGSSDATFIQVEIISLT